MDDIVDRLRDHQNGGRRAECEEAANQIEALRDMLDSARADMDVMRNALGVPVEPHQSLLERMVKAAQAKRGVVPECDDGKRVLREVFALCEDTEAKCSDEPGDFARGRRFEAKGIARAIGAWYQEEFCGRSHMGEPAAPAPDHFRDAAKMAPVHCTPTEHDGRIVYEHTSEPIPNADGFVLYAAPAPDRFRAAAKMMAVQPACMTCSGHGMVGGLLPNGGGYQADPCPDCAAPVTAGVPMPKPVAYGFGNTAITGHTNRLMMVRLDVPLDDQYAGAFWLPLVLADEARQYGAACRAAGEAAGYARGLAEAGRDTAPVVQNGEVLVTVTGLTGSGKSAIAGEIEIMCRALGLDAEWVDGAAEKHLTHAGWTEALEMYRPRVRIVEANIPRTDAALRGEV
ncbi:hypothetical protein [Methyloversatilis universalis]|nr:hypothetical protein [Methyloversatilis universalis]